MARGKKPQWDADSVRALRRHMELTQTGLAEVLGVRQQTVSEWETGVYQPRGASGTLLGRVADDAGYAWDSAPPPPPARTPPARAGKPQRKGGA